MIKNQIKTVLLLTILTIILLAIGSFWGKAGLTIAIIFSLVINLGSYWFSDKIVLKMYKAKPSKNKELNEIVKKLSKKANLPKPKTFIIPTQTPNAFATGRNPKHSAVAVTQGILQLLDKKELEGVLSHELSHVKNRDTLIQTISASIAGVIAYIAMIARFSAIFGGFDDDNSIIELLAIAIITPIIASIIQFAISRSREYLADESGAKIIKDGKPLASALEKLEKGNKIKPLKGNTSTSSMFIVNPFKNLSSLLSTHPSTQQRIKRLNSMQFK